MKCQQVGIHLTQLATRSCGRAIRAAQPAPPGEGVAEVKPDCRRCQSQTFAWIVLHRVYPGASRL
jgi:hypothetical protein